MPAPITTSTPTVRKHATALPHIFNRACPSPGKIHAARPTRHATPPDFGSTCDVPAGFTGTSPDRAVCAVDCVSSVMTGPRKYRVPVRLRQERQDFLLNRASYSSFVLANVHIHFRADAE